MLTEAITKIADLAVVAAKPVITTIPGDPRSAILSHGASKEIITLPPAVRSHSVKSLDAMLSAVEQWDESQDSIVWHNDDRITFVLDDTDRRDRVTMELSHSDAMERLYKLGEGQTLDQRGLIRLLNVELAGCLVAPQVILAVREIKWRASASGQSSVQHGRESMGRDVENEVSSIAADFPETIDLLLHVYSGVQDVPKVGVKLSIEIDAPNQRFTVRPLPEELSNAVNTTQTAIAEKLSGSGAPVLFGAPGN